MNKYFYSFFDKKVFIIVIIRMFLLIMFSISVEQTWAQSTANQDALDRENEIVIELPELIYSSQNSQSDSLVQEAIQDESMTNQPELMYVSNVTNINPLTENEPQPVLKAIEGWGSLKLGLDFNEINTVLSNEYPWVALRDSQNETPGGYFLEAYKNDNFTKMEFQFDQNQVLYLLRLELNSRFFSFIQLYNSLVEKYGPPQENSYIRVVWQDSQRSMELYRNNVLLYIDKTNWQERLPGSDLQDRRNELINSVFDNL